MSKPNYTNPSGFPENLPGEQIVENVLKAKMAAAAESFGYTPLETSAVEYLHTLESKGEIQNEIFTIGNPHSEGDAESSVRALRYDLTVPFARYTAQHYGELVFPFRRYQIQRVWRGERPQKGRYREFYQADIDVVAHSPNIRFDAEILSLFSEILASFSIGSFVMRVNNRKLLRGVCQAFGVTDERKAFTLIDKAEKFGTEAFKVALKEANIVPDSALEAFQKAIFIRVPLENAAEALKGIPTDADLEEGLKEITALARLAKASAACSFVFDLSIVRGLDYYTGTVFETNLIGHEKYGSICSGGRYDDLVGKYIPRKLSGVGGSIGLTRLLDILRNEKLADFNRATVTKILLCVQSEEEYERMSKLTQTLREKVATEVYHDPEDRLSKQLDSAEKRGIPFAFVPSKEGAEKGTLFNLKTKEKTENISEAEILENFVD